MEEAYYPSQFPLVCGLVEFSYFNDTVWATFTNRNNYGARHLNAVVLTGECAERFFANGGHLEELVNEARRVKSELTRLEETGFPISSEEKICKYICLEAFYDNTLVRGSVVIRNKKVCIILQRLSSPSYEPYALLIDSENEVTLSLEEDNFEGLKQCYRAEVNS